MDFRFVLTSCPYCAVGCNLILQVLDGKVTGANPVLSYSDANWVEDGLKSAEFLLVIDIFPTATSKLAHVVLPATSFAESDGTFTNSERRVQRVRPAIPPIPGKTN